MKRSLLVVFGVLLVLAGIGIQFVPVSRENPPVKAEPPWNSPGTRALAVRACFDCHSNESRWPWYSRVAPVSWFVVDHVREGREKLNFSEWPSGDFEEAVEEIEKGRMPLREYTWLHAEARLSAAEARALADGLRATEAASLESVTKD